MSGQTLVEHVMSIPEADSTFSSSVTAVGKANYGAPLYKPLLNNAWISNIGQEYVWGYFEYTTTSIGAVPGFTGAPINPMLGNWDALTPPWFVWFLSHYQSWACEFTLVFQAIAHSSHRGVLAISTTLHQPTPAAMDRQFLPVKNWDISGENLETEYPIPNIYAVSGRSYFDISRDLRNPIGTPSMPVLATTLGRLNIEYVTSLMASSMLPSTITVLIKLRPNISTLRLHHPVLASSQKFSSALTPWEHV